MIDAASTNRITTSGKLALLLVATMLLAACQRTPEPAEVPEGPRPVSAIRIEATAVDTKLRFPGRVRAAKRAELAFNIPGFISDFAVAEGIPVKAGTLIARLESSVIQARVNSAQAEFDRAQADLDRFQRLWDKDRAVTRAALDERVSRFELARTNLAAARQELADTVVHAPFDGVVTRRRVETFTSVQARQPIANFQDLNTLEVVINVPERAFRSEPPREGAYALFEGQAQQQVPLKLKSFSAEADPQTQTFEVVLSLLGDNHGLTLLPGMSATVVPFGDARSEPVSSIRIPLGAVSTAQGGGQQVWVVDETNTLRQRPVKLGEISGDRVEVLEGLEDGDWLVTAGLRALREGLQVIPTEAR